MSDDTTTIEITREQRKELERMKVHERESIKTVMDRLIHDNNRKEDTGDVDADDLQEAFGLPDAAIPDDLDERLRRIESAASTAEERTGSIENTLENMGGR